MAATIHENSRAWWSTAPSARPTAPCCARSASRDADFARPQVGIASTWSRVTPCNLHIGELAEAAALGVREAGGRDVLFNTITVSDGISMGSPGMRYSLVSREVIADSIETVAGAQGFDGLVAIGGCDKNMPGCMMAIARLDRPAVFSSTAARSGRARGAATSSSVFEAVGRHAKGDLERRRPRGHRAHGDPGSRFLRRHVHGEHDGLRHRGARHEPAEQLGPGGRVGRQAARLPARGRGRRAPAGARAPPVRDPDAARPSRMPSRP